MASNTDLLAVNKRHGVAIQVKTTDADNAHSHSKWVGFGYSTGYLRDKKPVFNENRWDILLEPIDKLHNPRPWRLLR